MYIYLCIYIYIYQSEGFALTGYDIPGCVEDGAWMLWENSSAAVVAIVAHPGGVGGAETLASPEIKCTKMCPQAHFCAFDFLNWVCNRSVSNRSDS